MIFGMTRLVGKSLEWVPLPGLQREQVIEELARDSVALCDRKTHVWVAAINNLGTMLYCYAIAVAQIEQGGRQFNAWHLKRIPEEVGPDAFDCPQDILDMCRVTNAGWREQVQRLGG